MYSIWENNMSSAQVRLTGSKLDTPITAPTMATRTTPPATMLSKKFLRDGVTPSAAWATSGIIIDVVSAAAVNPVTTFSLNEEEAALTWSRPLGLLTAPIDLHGFTGSGLKNASELGILFWVAPAKGRAIEAAEVEAIGSFFLFSLLSSVFTP